jgi:cytoplasmic iron level regulating protein YaaA (DUF328/UPF0246 family)
VLILVPPSEGKSSPESGPQLDLATLSFPELDDRRREILQALVALCRDQPNRASGVLGLGTRQASEVAANAALLSRPCAPAIEVYSGVLYDALDYPRLSSTARRRARASLVIASALWGLIRPGDLIPAYRLSAGVTLPQVGPLAGAWRAALASVLERTRGVIVDLRSGAYEALGPVPSSAAHRTVTARVLQERDGRRTVVSHHNKATKGRLVAALLSGAHVPASSDDVIDLLTAEGYHLEPSTARDGSTLVDVVVHEL